MPMMVAFRDVSIVDVKMHNPVMYRHTAVPRYKDRYGFIEVQ